MIRRISLGVVSILIMISLTGCTADNDNPQESGNNQEIDQVIESDTETETIISTDSSGIEISVYHSDEDALNLISDTETISELTPEKLLEKLAEYNLTPTDVVVNSFEEVIDQEEKALNLDLSKEYATMIRQMGTTGEFYMLKGLCNTFLKAYDAEKIQLTIDGEILVTGHAEIEGYMYFYEGDQ